MGVRRLQTFMEQYCPDACYEVDILEIAQAYRLKENREPVIVVDGSCCFRKLYGSLDWICGGQYREFAEAINFFIDKFQDAGIQLMLFFDGATQESKRPVWVSRRLASIEKAQAVFDALKAGSDVSRISNELHVIPPGVGNMMSSMSKLRCKVQRSIRECDEEIASYAQTNRCLAILAQDSDFVIYRNGAQFYLSSENLNLNNMTTLVYDRNALAKHLRLKLHELPIFASLMGNDFISADDLKPFHTKLTGNKGRGPYVPFLVNQVAEFVRSLPQGNELFLFLRQISLEVFGTPDRSEDLQKSILSYGAVLRDNTKSVHHQCESWNNILTVAHSNYIEMESPSYIYNILRRLPFEMSTALEDYRLQMPPAAEALRLMRQRVYGVALREYPRFSDDDLIVEEWCVTGPNSLKAAAKVKGILPPDDSPCLLDMWTNMETTKVAKFKLLAWIASGHLVAFDISKLPHEIVPTICLLSYLYHDVKVLRDWEVTVFAAVAVDVQVMSTEELSLIHVKKVNVKGVQLATMYARSITHITLANAICGKPIPQQWLRYDQLFDGKLFQTRYAKGPATWSTPTKGSSVLYKQICDIVLG